MPSVEFSRARFTTLRLAYTVIALGLSIAATASSSYAEETSSAPASVTQVKVAASESTADSIRPSTTGFYPLWENTGYVERHREIYLGTNGAHYGIADVAHIGTQPIHFLYRAPNAYAKFSLLKRGSWNLSAQAGFFYLMNEASRAFLSPMYASRLDNPDFNVILLPMTFSATYELSDWLQLHQSATMMGIYSASGQLTNEVFPGYTAVAEFLARRRHSVLAHFGEVGFWKHDFSMMGISYRYHNTWIDAQIGYFYRFRADGNQAAPMVSLGFLM